MTPSFDLSGSSAIVTGASTGLGRGRALALAAAGADLLLVDHVSSSDTATEVQALGRKAQVLSVDLMQMSSIPLVARTAIETFGKIDILVNNAGIIRRTPAIDFSEKDWDDVLTINSKTVFFLSQAGARDMITRKYGKIIKAANIKLDS